MSESEILKIPSAERLFNLTMFLLGTKPRTLKSILDSVEGYEKSKDSESNRRMFIRDKKVLAGLDIPVRIVKTNDPLSGYETEGYIIDPSDFYLPAVNFTEEEIASLKRLSGVFLGKMRTPALNDLDWALSKISSLSGRGERSDPPAAAPDRMIMEFDRKGGGDDPELIGTLIDAVSEKRRVKIVYSTPGSKETSTRNVDPYGLFVRRGYWYLHGYCHRRNEVRSFRTDRIRKVDMDEKREPPHFELPENYSFLEDVRARAPWEFG
ncbi:MAG TPA: WYL domain-containing protein, partial [bacterium]|nr:WYL domain-containing protein [bacterium]